MQQYQHSGVVPLVGGLTTITLASLSAAVLGTLYPFGFYYIPFIYVSFLLTLGLGATLGSIVGRTAKSFKVRNMLFVSAAAVLAAVVAQYFCWGATLYAMCPWKEFGALWQQAGLLTFMPQSIWGLMQHMYANGAWSIKNQVVSGPILAGIWLIEAGTIFYLTVKTARSYIADEPFCETCETWLVHEPALALQGQGGDDAWSDVRSGNLEALNELTRVRGDETAYVALTVAGCPHCQQVYYLSAKTRQQTVDNEGKKSTQEYPLITNLAISRQQFDRIAFAGQDPAPIAAPEEIPQVGPPPPEPPDQLPQIRV